jgi:hypothetical protein
VVNIRGKIHEVMSIHESFVAENDILWAKGLSYLCKNGKRTNWLKQLKVAIST